MIRLYSYWRSSASWRVRIGLNLKGLSFDYVAIHLVEDGGHQHRKEYVEKNAMHQVPTLEVEEGGRSVALTQSLAILTYLEARHPEPALWPEDPLMRTRAVELAEICNSGIQPLHNLGVLRSIEALGGDRKEFVRPILQKGLAALEVRVRQLSGRFCVGDAPSIADVCVIPQLASARRFELDLGAYESLLRVEEACAELDAFASAHPTAQPDVPRA